MKLTDEDKAYLLNVVCYGDGKRFTQELPRIELAAENTKYRWCWSIYGRGLSDLTCEQAIKMLGREGWLAGIARSAFFVTDICAAPNGEAVEFDSRAIFPGCLAA